MATMHWLLLALLLLGALAWWLRRGLEHRTAPVAEGEDDSGPDPGYEIEIGDELDLHGVAAGEIDEAVDAFVDLGLERGRDRIKIVHGKGTGRLRQRVRARLARHPGVGGWEDAASPGSGWGATIVRLRPPSEVARRERED
jgi:dsDNA-specific endonuclease/ATPase MutS2